MWYIKGIGSCYNISFIVARFINGATELYSVDMICWPVQVDCDHVTHVTCSAVHTCMYV